MANQQQVPLHTALAGAAHGVWVAFLSGVVLMLVVLILREIAMRFYPDYLSLAWGLPVHQLPEHIARLFACFKVVIGCFFLLGVALSSWWRALPSPTRGH